MPPTASSRAMVPGSAAGFSRRRARGRGAGDHGDRRERCGSQAEATCCGETPGPAAAASAGVCDRRAATTSGRTAGASACRALRRWATWARTLTGSRSTAPTRILISLSPELLDILAGLGARHRDRPAREPTQEQ
ncbi:hypothetical protein [Streptomyces sp. NPDC047706]|uniref:hypothetical protein n=1 Tax=Streptomyces sp. NPDC047706 TaxID=3365486 RepID=UPI003712436E